LEVWLSLESGVKGGIGQAQLRSIRANSVS
jgi:hypothetical protein